MNRSARQTTKLATKSSVRQLRIPNATLFMNLFTRQFTLKNAQQVTRSLAMMLATVIIRRKSVPAIQFIRSLLDQRRGILAIFIFSVWGCSQENPLLQASKKVWQSSKGEMPFRKTINTDNFLVKLKEKILGFRFMENVQYFFLLMSGSLSS